MELVETLEISGEEREIADAYAREQIDGVNSNLDGLGYGENGAYNILDLSKLRTLGFSIEEGNITNIKTDTRTKFYLFIALIKKDGTYKDAVTEFFLQNVSKDFTFSIPSGYEKMSMKHNGSSNDIFIANFNISDFGLKENDIITVHISVSSNDPTVVGGIVINELAIVKGSTFTEYEPYIPSVKMLADEVSAQNESLYQLKNDLSKQCKKDDITTNETLIGTFNGKNYYRKLFTGISGSGSSITVNVGEKIEIYNYYGRAYVYGQSGASNAKYPIPNMNYYIESQNSGETSFQLTIPTSSDTRKVDLVIEYTKVDE